MTAYYVICTQVILGYEFRGAKIRSRMEDKGKVTFAKFCLFPYLEKKKAKEMKPI